MRGTGGRTRDEFWRERDARSALGRDELARRQARRVGAVGFVLAAALPVVLWHRVILDIASQFRLDLNYVVSELSPWILIVLGLAFAAPVVWSAGRDPESRWYPRSRNAYAGWGITLYLLGIGLATQVAQISSNLTP
jgi:hypothetical protein